MIERFTKFIDRYWQIPAAQTYRFLHMGGVIFASASFVLVATVLVSYDNIFLGFNNTAALQVGDSAPEDIRAPISLPSYISDVLTEQQQQDARNNAAPVYYPPDPAVSRQQADLAQQILTYIENIRSDPYGTREQKTADLRQINDLTWDEAIVGQALTLDDGTWAQVEEQITTILERVMRGEIRDTSLDAVIAQLPMQVGVRFLEDQAQVIVAVVKDLIRPNTLLNQEATDAAREAAAANITIRRSFERGEVVVRAGETIDAAAYEAMDKLGLLLPSNRRFREVGRAGLASIMVLVVTGMYISRFKPSLFQSSRFMVLLAALFVIVLLGARISGNYGQIYLYPTSALALLYVALVGPELAVIGGLGLGILIGLMQDNSLELMLLVSVSSIMAALTLRRAERLNGYFRPGLLVGLTNVAIIVTFYPGSFLLGPESRLGELIIYGLMNGILAAAVALGGMYIVTLLFNLPTGLKLVELTQPSQPLLQRLLREAPGTYQHSLQVANLGEQAANAIGANADLVRVAAMYHDIGKMLNPAFFSENQVEGVNPHETLNNPLRSAEIIIHHVTDGDKMARQYRLPNRIRDFILEHHGTTLASYFYQQALEAAGDEKRIDIEQFTYPGPKPQTRETGILMLADSCEATVRSRKPTRKQEIADTVQQIFEDKMRSGQLDESGLTLNDIKVTRRIFVDMLQAVFHPRISYPSTPRKEQVTAEINRALVRPESTPKSVERINRTLSQGERTDEYSLAKPSESVRDTDKIPVIAAPGEAPTPSQIRLQTKEIPIVKGLTDEDETPLPEVPPLPRTGDYKAVKLNDNGGKNALEE